MAHATYLREKARVMRIERLLTIDELAEQLALPRTAATSSLAGPTAHAMGSSRFACTTRSFARGLGPGWIGCEVNGH